MMLYNRGGGECARNRTEKRTYERKKNMSEKKNKRPFGMRDNWAYAAGDFGCNMSFAL